MSDRENLAALIKDAYYAARDNRGTMHTAADDAAEAILASRWLREHDHTVRTEYEERRKPEPMVIQNIDGEPAKEWLARDRARVAAEALEEVAKQARLRFRPFAECQEWSEWLKDSAARIRSDAGVGGGGDDARN